MAELVKAYLVRRNDEQVDPLHCDAVKTFVVGKDIRWESGKLSLPFEGNRVDVILRQGGGTPGAASASTASGPSELPELYGFTRRWPSPAASGRW